MDFAKARFNMVEQQVRPWEVFDPRLLESLGHLAREDFMPAGLASLAYVDMEVPLASGAVMLAPRVQARLVQDAAIEAGHRVLEVGTGTGYMAALMARQAGPTGSVLTLERDEALASQARANLAKAGLMQVNVRQADGAKGAAAQGPFDAIILSGSVAEVPRELLEQLKPGGRLVAIVGEEPSMRATVFTRSEGQGWTQTQPWDVNTARLEGFAETSTFRF